MKKPIVLFLCTLAVLVLFAMKPVCYAVCGDGNIDSEEQCDDGNTVDGDGCTGACKIECEIHCDCLQYYFCYKGTCLRDSKEDVYCCDKPGCPPGHWCINSANDTSRCPEDETYECQDACDCGPAHACIDIPGVGKRCVKDVNDPWLPGGTAIFGATIPPGEPTYCCAEPVCLSGRSKYSNPNTPPDVIDFRCYDRNSQSSSNLCGEKSCYFQGDCEPGQTCVDQIETVPGGLCNSDVGRCFSNAIVEAVFGYSPSYFLTSCDRCTNIGGDCVQGWKPGGSYAIQRVLGTCKSCGNGICDSGEYPETCSEDCFCGDGECAPSERGDCTIDCGQCGNLTCEGLETSKNCPSDCDVYNCGDGSCTSVEINICDQDCRCEDSATYYDFPSVCGDNFCDDYWPASPENCVTCPQDCDSDIDGDGILDCIDQCPNDSENDADKDGICESGDNCPLIANENQNDNDEDGQGDACDFDDDNDGVSDSADNCPYESNPNQSDIDSDGAGDVCDTDDDNDGIIDAYDQCVNTGAGDVVNEVGCSIVDLCPCDTQWKNHGSYVSCVARASEEFMVAGLITEVEKDIIVSGAAQSDCGSKKK